MLQRPPIALFISWIRLFAFLAMLFIVLPSVLSTCATPGEEFIALACLASLSGGGEDDEDEWIYCDAHFMNLYFHIYSSADSLLIPGSKVRVYNKNAQAYYHDVWNVDGIISTYFWSEITPEELMPCWDWCNDIETAKAGHTYCLEEGTTWKLFVEAHSEGYSSQVTTLIMDNQYTGEIMNFYLDPL